LFPLFSLFILNLRVSCYAVLLYDAYLLPSGLCSGDVSSTAALVDRAVWVNTT